MKPDDGHTCQPLLGEDGELSAMVRAEPGALEDPLFRDALEALVAAARRRYEADPDRAEKDARQDAARERSRARLARIRGEGP